MSYSGDGWRCWAAITVDNTLVDGNQTEFQVYLSEVNLPEEMLDADGFLPAKSAGGDVRFSSDVEGATPLEFDLVEFQTNNNPAAASANIWVNIPTLLGGSDTTIYVWWANPDASAPPVDDTYGQHETWKTGNACAVRFMCDDGKDRTENGLDFVETGVSFAAGQIDDCAVFDADVTEAALFTLPGGLQSQDEHYWSGWIWVDAATGGVGQRLFSYGYGTNELCYELEISDWDAVFPKKYRIIFSALFSTQAGRWREDGWLLADVWNHMGISYDGGNVANNPVWTINGADPAITETQAPVGTYDNDGASCYMGRDPAANRLTGKLDEVKVRNVILSQAAIHGRETTEYNNEVNPGAFASAGDRLFIPRSMIRV